MFLYRAAAFTEGTTGECPTFPVAEDDRLGVLVGGSDCGELPGDFGIGTSLADEGAQVRVPLQVISELLLVGDEPVGPDAADAGGAGRLTGCQPND